MGTRQSEELAAESAAMRSFDAAMTKAEDLSVRQRARVLRYAAERIADHLEYLEAVSATPDAGLGGQGSVTVVHHQGRGRSDG